MELDRYKGIAASMASFNFKALSQAASTNAQLREHFQIMNNAGGAAEFGTRERSAKNERPFVSDLAWAYYLAYESIIASAVGKARLIEAGIEGADAYIRDDKIREYLAAALPHQKEYINSHDPAMYYHLIEELENALMSELRKLLSGQPQDEESIRRASAIRGGIKEIFDADAKHRVEAVVTA